LDDLKINQWVEIISSLDGKVARSMVVHAPGDQNGRVTSGKLQGQIIAFDKAAGTLLFHDHARRRLMSFAVPRDLSASLMFGKRSLDPLHDPQAIASASATVYLSPDHKGVRRILVNAPLLRGRVDAVDLGRRKLIVKQNGTNTTWDLPVDVTVLVGRRYG